MDQNIKWFYNKKAENITKVLLSKEYDAIFIDHLDNVKDFLTSKISPSESLVLDETPFLNLLELSSPLKEKGCVIFDYKKDREAILADNFITQCDFITENGELVFSNDFASCAAIFGPNKIFVIVSAYKIIKTLSEIDKKSNNNFSVIHHGRKFPNKYTVIVVSENI